jgi:hypothetical protein
MARVQAFAMLGVLAVPLGHLALPAASPVAAAAQRPLPDQDTLYREVRENLARSTREQHRYAYKERRTELHTNPFGRLGTGEMVLSEVTPGPDRTVYYRRVLERDGRPVPDARPERRERRVRSGRSPMDEAVDALRFTVEGREPLGGRDMIVVRFEPRPDARPQTREGKMAKSFAGKVWIDEAAREVARAEATAIDDLSYGFGLVARLNEGTTVTLTRERVDDAIWLPTSIQFRGSGRALLFRKLNIDFGVEWFDYRRVDEAAPAGTESTK